MSDLVAQAIIAGVVTIVLAWMSNRTKNAVIQTGEKAEAKVEEVKKTLEETTTKQDVKLDGIAAVGIESHKLMNSQYGLALRMSKETSRWKADREPTEENMRAAELAEKLWKEHDEKQRIVDAEKAKERAT